MHLNVLSFVPIFLATRLATATPIASPSGGVDAVERGGSFGGFSGGGRGGNYTSSSSSTSRSGSFAAGAATGYVGGDWVDHGPNYGGASGGSYLEETPPDCLVAEELNKKLKPKADCSYSYVQSGKDGFLYYVIRITPTGQNSQGWAKGVIDNIKRECGAGHVAYFPGGGDFHSRNEDYGKPRKIKGDTFRGLEVTVPLKKWTPGEDERKCVHVAIKKASCRVNMEFKNGSCYQKAETLA